MLLVALVEPSVKPLALVTFTEVEAPNLTVPDPAVVKL